MDVRDETLRWLLNQLPEADLRERLEAVEAEIASLSRARNVLRIALNAQEMAAEITELRPGETITVVHRTEGSPPNGERPGTRAALRAVLMRAPNRTMRTADIMRALEELGWLPDTNEPRKAVGAALSTMVHRTKELDYVERATYRLRDGSEHDSPSSDDDEVESEETDRNRLFTGSAVGKAGGEDV